MLLIGGKNLVPLVSAAVIQSIGWRWVFIIVAIIVAVMFVLTFLCVPETCWDRTPLTSDTLRRRESRSSLSRNRSDTKDEKISTPNGEPVPSPIPSTKVRFADVSRPAMATVVALDPEKVRRSKSESTLSPAVNRPAGLPILPHASPASLDLATMASAPVSRSASHHSLPRVRSSHSLRRLERQEYAFEVPPQDVEPIASGASHHTVDSANEDTLTEGEIGYRFRKKTYREMLTVYQGRISHEKWWKSALRPFILYCYPAIAFVFPC
jgi:hypothetical protein